MNLAGLVIAVTVMVAGAEDDATQPVTITMIAASATQEGPAATGKKSYGGMVKSMAPTTKGKKRGKHFDKELKEIEQAVADLPYNTYRKVNIITERVRIDEEARFDIDSTYTLHAKPLEKDRKNRVRMDLRIDEKVEVEDKDTKEKKPVVREALSTASSIAPGKPLVLGGLKLDKGRLVVVLSVEP